MTPIMRQIITGNKIYVLDSFDRADIADGLGNAQTGQVWSVVQGTWGISSGKAYNSSATYGDTVIIPVKSPKHQGKADIYSTSYLNYYPGIYIGYVNSTNYLRIRPAGNDIKLAKCIGGSTSIVASATVGFTDFKTHTITWRKYFDRVLIGVNGVWAIDYQLSASDAIAVNGSKVGFMAGGASAGTWRWDNLKIVSLS